MATAELDEIYARVKNWGRWGADDERGALNHLTDAHRALAAALVRDRSSVSLAHDLPVGPAEAAGVDSFPHDRSVSVADLEAAEERQKLRVGTGDILIISTGRDFRRTEKGGVLSPFADGLSGLHPTCLPWLHERGIAVLG